MPDSRCHCCGTEEPHLYRCDYCELQVCPGCSDVVDDEETEMPTWLLCERCFSKGVHMDEGEDA